jgi:hypothetical protein
MMNWIQKKIYLSLLVGFLIPLSVAPCKASDQGESTPEKLVEVETPLDYMKSYRDRKRDSGYIFGFNQLQMMPDTFGSSIDQVSYTDLNGTKSISINRFLIGKKWNFSKLSIALNASLGSGSASFKNITGRSASLTTKGIGAGAYLDGLTEEPYFVPFIEVLAMDLNLTEQADALKVNTKYSYSPCISFGALIQLNWIDPPSALDAMNSIGLENSYIKVAYESLSYNTGTTDYSGATIPEIKDSSSTQIGFILEF